MITALLSLFGQGALGAFFGSLFSYLLKREERAELVEKNTHDEKMLGLQNAQALALADKQIQGVKVAGEQVVAAKEADAFTASQVAANAPGGSPILEFFKGVMRPVITCYILALATYFGYNISALVGGMKALDGTALFALYGQIIDEVFFLTNLCVSWWFGARGSSPRVSVSQAASPTS